MTDIKAYIDKGYIHARIILEIIGKPKEHVDESIKEYIKKIENTKNLVFLSKTISESNKLPDKELFSTFADIELLIKGFSQLAEFCFNYMPASIEILEPGKLVVDANSMTNLFNDFQDKLHKADFMTKSMAQQNKLLIDNFSSLLKNLLFTLLKDKGLNLKDICKYTGFKKEDMEEYLKKMIEDKKIRMIGDKYFYEL